MFTYRVFILVLALLMIAAGLPARADETCNSPYLSALIKGQEDTCMSGPSASRISGDGSDKLVTVDVNPRSKSYGKVVHSISVGSRGEAHHMGFSDDRKYLWAGGLDDSKIYVVRRRHESRQPEARPRHHGLDGKDRIRGPPYLLCAARQAVDRNTVQRPRPRRPPRVSPCTTTRAVFVAKYDIPTASIGGVKGDGYGYDIAINPGQERDAHLEFHGWNNYMRGLGRSHQGSRGHEALRRNDGVMESQDHAPHANPQRAGLRRWRFAGHCPRGRIGRSRRRR